jgi:hypothetical protein
MNIDPAQLIKLSRTNVSNYLRRVLGDQYRNAPKGLKTETLNTVMTMIQNERKGIEEGTSIAKDFLTGIIQDNKKTFVEFLASPSPSKASKTRSRRKLTPEQLKEKKQLEEEKKKLLQQSEELKKEREEGKKKRSQLISEKIEKGKELVEEFERVKDSISQAGKKIGIPDIDGFMEGLRKLSPSMFDGLMRQITKVDTPEQAVDEIVQYGRNPALRKLRSFITPFMSLARAEQQGRGMAEEEDEEKEEFEKEEFEEDAEGVYDRGTDTGKEREEIADMDDPRGVFDQAVDFVEQMTDNPVAETFVNMIEDSVGDETPPLRNILRQANKVIETAMKKGLKRPRALQRKDQMVAESSAAQARVQAERALDQEAIMRGEQPAERGGMARAGLHEPGQPSIRVGSEGFRETPVSVQDLKPVGDKGPPEDIAEFESDSMWNSQTGDFSYTLENPYPKPQEDLSRPEPGRPQRITMSQLPKRRDRPNPYMSLLLSSSSRRGSARLSRSLIDQQSIEKFINMDINHKALKQLQDHEPVNPNKLTPWYTPSYHQGIKVSGY